MVRVEMYVKTTCPYCYRAEQLLRAKGVDYETYVLDYTGTLREEMIQRASGRSTVPQIFINGRHIGGCDDLYALERQGELEHLLAA